MLNESRDDVFCFFKRVVRRLLGCDGSPQNLTVVPRVGLNDADVDRVAEDTGSERTDVLYRVPTEFLRQTREKQTPVMSLVISEGRHSEMPREMLRPNLFVTVKRRMAKIL